MLMATMVCTVTWQIFTRFILHNPSLYTEEMAGFLLIWIGMLGSSYALFTRSHVGIDILTKKFSGYKKVVSEVLIYSLIIIYSLFVLIIGGSKLVIITFTLRQLSPALGISMGYIYLVIPITGILMITISLDFIKKTIKK